MRRRFFWAMVAVAVVTVVVGGFAAAIMVDRAVDSSMRDEFRRQADATARLIDDDLRSNERPPGAVPLPALRELSDLLRVVALVGGHDHVEAAIVGEAGVVTILGDGSGILIAQVPGGPASVERPREFEAEVDGDPVAAFVAPVPLPDRGTVLIVFGTDLEIIPWADVVRRLLWALGLGVLLAALFAGSLSRFLARRLEGLSSAVRRLAGGDHSARAVVEGDDEITDVAVAFNDMAEQLDESRRREREFLVSVSHDLRTPLTTITGYVEAINEGLVGEGDMGRVAGVLHRETDRLRRLVEDLMLLSRLEAREFSLRPEEVDLTGLLGGIAETFRGEADAASVEVLTDLESLPRVWVDPDRVSQVVGNLFDNALRYTPEGGAVTLGLACADDEIRISVGDTGPGIDPVDLPRVFERLYVARRYRAVRPEGSGLGLSIVKEIMSQMGGRAEVSSEPGQGTTVSVMLPRSMPPPPPA